jgi:hypothetical protein
MVLTISLVMAPSYVDATALPHARVLLVVLSGIAVLSRYEVLTHLEVTLTGAPRLLKVIRELRLHLRPKPVMRGARVQLPHRSRQVRASQPLGKQRAHLEHVVHEKVGLGARAGDL